MPRKLSMEGAIWKAILDKDKLSDREVLERRMDEPMRPAKPADHEAFGLFDRGREPDLFN